MKILILQLARLGDIYMSWPAMRALRRCYPHAEIHLLTRPRFEGALQGLNAIDKHWSLPSSRILSPLIESDADIDMSLDLMREFTAGLRSESYDWVINFTFSPFSSYLTHALKGSNTRISGYSRYADGSFAPADEVGAYFYGQVGIGKANRVHLADIFSSLVDVTYIEEDWAAPVVMSTITDILPEDFITVHIGASEAHKSLSPTFWGKALRYFSLRFPNVSIALIGSALERDRAQIISEFIPQGQLVNLVGATQISDLFAVLLKAKLLVGGDSAPIHMASLADTPTLNVSVGNVNFWETGPKASLSFIYRSEDESKIHGERLGEIISLLLEGQVAPELVVRAPGLASYAREESLQDRFQWDLIQAIYMKGSYPLADRIEILQGAMKLQEINNFAMEQLDLVPSKGVEFAAPFLARAEEIIQSISQWVPELCPLIDWYRAEKVRIGPGSQEDVLAATMNVHKAFGRHLSVYIPQEEFTKEGVGDGAL